MLFSQEEEHRITSAIKAAERRTTGEIRLFVEDFCLRDHPIQRAVEIFEQFGMFNTRARNAVLIYLAEQSRHFAIWGDEGIHDRVGFKFWEDEKRLLREELQQGSPADGLCKVIFQVGEKLQLHFPASDTEHNDNELPDDIIYG